MRLIWILFLMLLLLLAGCFEEPQKDFNADKEIEVPGNTLVLSHSIKNPNNTLAGIEKNGDVYSINLNQSPEQKIVILIGNRIERPVLVKETDFSCRGKNIRGSTVVGVETLDYYFECVNCVYKESCALESNEILEASSGCLLNRGKKLVRIEKGSGLEFIAIVKPVEVVEAKMDCSFSIKIFDKEDEQYSTDFTINYS